MGVLGCLRQVPSPGAVSSTASLMARIRVWRRAMPWLSRTCRHPRPSRLWACGRLRAEALQLQATRQTTGGRGPSPRRLRRLSLPGHRGHRGRYGSRLHRHSKDDPSCPARATRFRRYPWRQSRLSTNGQRSSPLMTRVAAVGLFELSPLSKRWPGWLAGSTLRPGGCALPYRKCGVR
jgi:hypothetical protein